MADVLKGCSNLKFVEEKSEDFTTSLTHPMPMRSYPPSTNTEAGNSELLSQTQGLSAPEIFGPKASFSDRDVLEEPETDPFGLLDVPHFAWPRLGPRDACLLRYFIEDLARWVRILHATFSLSV